MTDSGPGRGPVAALAFLSVALIFSVVLLVRSWNQPPSFERVFVQPTALGSSESVAGKTRGTLRAWRGRHIAQQHCGSCHLVPRPDVLPRAAWPAVLRNMAVRMGAGAAFPQLPGEERGLVEGLARAGQLPGTSILSAAEWLSVAEYYYRKAPAVLPLLGRPPLQGAAEAFRAHVVFADERGSASDVTMVTLGPRLIQAGILTTGATTATFRLLDFISTEPVGMSRGHIRLRRVRSLPAPAVALFAARPGGPPLVALLGGPPSTTAGLVLPLSTAFAAAGEPRGLDRPLFRAPERIAHALPFRSGDITALVVSAFGSFRGGLYFLVYPQPIRGPSVGRPAPRELLALRGMVAAAAGDFNGDGIPDLAALSAQDREGLHVLYGLRRKPGADILFRPTQPLVRGPEHGFTGLAAFDFDGDGRTDLALSNGDNGDFALAGPKPYHGVSVLRSTGEGFLEVFRLPLYGACRLAAADLDGDGRPDLVATALYSAPGTPFAHERALVLYNRGPVVHGGKRVFRFEPRLLSVPAGFRPGVLSVADMDGDGDQDIVMGALPYLSDPSGNRTPLNRGTPLLVVFENRRRGPK